jgi:hypothetical protein
MNWHLEVEGRPSWSDRHKSRRRGRWPFPVVMQFARIFHYSVSAFADSLGPEFNQAMRTLLSIYGRPHLVMFSNKRKFS